MAHSHQKNNDTNIRLDLFFELSEDFLCIAGFDGYFKRINPAFVKLLGYSEDELFSRPINDFVHKKDQRRTDANRARLRDNNRLLNFENRYVSSRGKTIWLSWTSIPIEKDQLVYAIAKDITHHKELEARRNKLLADLTKTNKDLTQLTYRTSHDLRSPVNNLITLLGLMETTKIQDGEIRELMELIKMATEGLKENLDHFEETLGNTGPVTLSDRIDLMSIFRSVKESIGTLIDKSGAIFEIDFSEIGEIRSNRMYLESIFLNLITNSIKYIRPGHFPHIYIRSQKKEHTVQLIFEDEGLGFDMAKVEGKIFGLKQKFHNHSDSKGIGLYLVHSHVINAGGTIKVESKLNEGAKFTIALPL